MADREDMQCDNATKDKPETIFDDCCGEEKSAKYDLTSSDTALPAKNRRLQEYRCSYTKSWPFIVPSKKGSHFVLCKTCQVDISIGSGGGNDISRHIKSTKHQSIEKSRAENPITSFFTSKGTVPGESEHRLSVTRAEVMMCELIVHHNLPLTGV